MKFRLFNIYLQQIKQFETAMKFPIVLVVSDGQLKSQEIINNIRKIPAAEENEILTTHMNQDIVGHILRLDTKYYSTKLYLVAFEGDITTLPVNIEKCVECLLIFFDSQEKSFTKQLATYDKFVKENEIELSIFLCEKLCDTNEGVTYKEIKEANRAFDVIELDRKGEDYEEDNLHDPLGYNEVMQALQNFLWSNVNIKTAEESYSNSNPSRSDEVDVDKDMASDSMEAEVEEFGKLLTEVLHFKHNSASWSRNERLAYMEKFANKFQCLISNDDSSSENEN